MTGRKGLRGDDNHFPDKKSGILWVVLLALGLAVLLLTAGGLLLLDIDRRHDDYQAWITGHLLKADNYYDGEVWFAAAATLIGAAISAVPGIMFGILALRQTRKLHELESRYHRPNFHVKNMKLSFISMKLYGKQGMDLNEPLTSQQNLCAREAERHSCNWGIILETAMLETNGIVVKKMEIESVIISFPNANPKKVFTLLLSTPGRKENEMRSFKGKLQNDHMEYTLHYSLNPFTLKRPDGKSDFEKCIEEFVFWREGRDPGYLQMDLTVNMNINFEYGEKQATKCMLRAALRAESSMYSKLNNFIIENEQNECYSTYEV